MYNSELEAFKSFISQQQQQQIPVERKEYINQILKIYTLRRDEYLIRFKFNTNRTQPNKFARILTRRKKILLKTKIYL